VKIACQNLSKCLQKLVFGPSGSGKRAAGQGNSRLAEKDDLHQCKDEVRRLEDDLRGMKVGVRRLENGLRIRGY
jgi:hypothetical protein